MTNNEYNVPEEKTMGYNDMFSEKGFDEMQLAQKYKIGFKLFRTLCWVQYAAAFIILLVAEGLENNIFMYIGAGLLSIWTAFYIVYLARLASEGLMNTKFTAVWTRKIYLIMAIAIILVWVTALIIRNGKDFLPAYVCINLGTMYIGNWLCSRENMKVLEKMLKDETEEE